MFGCKLRIIPRNGFGAIRPAPETRAEWTQSAHVHTESNYNTLARDGLPSVTSRALICSSPEVLTFCSGDNIEFKLSTNASFSDRLWSPAPAILKYGHLAGNISVGFI